MQADVIPHKPVLPAMINRKWLLVLVIPWFHLQGLQRVESLFSPYLLSDTHLLFICLLFHNDLPKAASQMSKREDRKTGEKSRLEAKFT